MDLGIAMQILLVGLQLLNKEISDPIKSGILNLQRDWDEENAKASDEIDDGKLASIRAEFMRIVSVYGSAVQQAATKT